MADKLSPIKVAILREIHNYHVTPLEIAAACAHMALAQATTFGTLMLENKLNAEDAPTNVPAEVMEMLKSDESALFLFRYVAQVLMGLAQALPDRKGLMPYGSIIGTFKLNVGMVEDADLRKIAKRISETTVFSLEHLNYDVISKTTQAAAWFYMFMIYQEAAIRLDVKDAQMENFTEVPQGVVDCLKAITNSVKAQGESYEDSCY